MEERNLVIGCENPEQNEKQRKSVLDNLDILKHKIFVDDKGRNYFIYHIHHLQEDPAGIGLLVQYEDRQRGAKLFPNILSNQEALNLSEEFIHELETFNDVKYLNPLNNDYEEKESSDRR